MLLVIDPKVQLDNALKKVGWQSFLAESVPSFTFFFSNVLFLLCIRHSLLFVCFFSPFMNLENK